MCMTIKGYQGIYSRNGLKTGGDTWKKKTWI
nr:MAG TPA: hypothetical protein [Caudoviricetes sp.]